MAVRTPEPITPRRPPLDQPAEARDMRNTKPPALAFLLRASTFRVIARIVSLLAVDALAIFSALFVALSVKAVVKGDWGLHEVIVGSKEYFAFTYLLTVLLFSRSELYAERAARPGSSKVVAALFQVMIVAIIYGAASNASQFNSYYIFYGTLIFAIAIVVGLRWLYEHATGLALRSAGYHRRAIVVGEHENLATLSRSLESSRHEPMQVVAQASITARGDGITPLTELSGLDALLDRTPVDEVILADPDYAEEDVLNLVSACHSRGVRVRIAPATTDVLIRRAEFVPGSATPLFELRAPVFEGFDFWTKRAFDLIVAALLIVALAPLMAIVFTAIKLDSRGPLLYRSRRPGLGGEPFDCLKLRTMVVGADQIQATLEQDNEADGPLFKIRRDPRVTRVGALLRRFSIDELPQLFNVLRGEMSLVGPRPLPDRDFAQLGARHQRRYEVLPGMTGLWQISGRSDLTFDELVRLDFQYLESWSVSLDLAILAKTIPAVVRRRGAY
ncbi:MAG: sugar transferase [Solirubrobacteraceae bacterium]|nr:sugar transferase [Solirubrobacteraceae bacterium]